MFKQKQVRRVVAAAGLLLLAVAVARCGTGSEESASGLSGGAVAVETEATVDFGSPRIWGISDSRYYIHANELIPNLEDALGRSLGRHGVISTDLPQFFVLSARLERFAGCSGSYVLYCFGSYSAYLGITANAGPNQIGQSGMMVPFESAEPGDFNRRLSWTVDRLVDDLVEQGLLTELGVETPYF